MILDGADMTTAVIVLRLCPYVHGQVGVIRENGYFTYIVKHKTDIEFVFFFSYI